MGGQKIREGIRGQAMGDGGAWEGRAGRRRSARETRIAGKGGGGNKGKVGIQRVTGYR